MGLRYRKMEDQRPWPGFSRNQDFAEGRGLTPKVKTCELGDALSKLMQPKRITDWGLRAKSPAAGRFFVFLFSEKIAILMLLNHILHVLRPFERPKVLTFKSQLKN